MATYRKPLYDNEGNIIIPAMTSDQTGWVKTSDIDDGAVTSVKIDDGAVTASKIDFNAQSGTFSVPVSTTNFSTYARLLNIVVIINFIFNTSSSIPSETTIATIGDTVSIRYGATMANDDGTVSRILLNTNGTIVADSTIPAGWHTCQLVYIK